MFRKSRNGVSSSARPSGGKVNIVQRAQSLPCDLHKHRVKGIMKFSSVDASLHAKYGQNNNREGKENDSDSGERRGIKFKDIIIREYGRTVGDNPSCSSGPPIS